MTIYDHIETAIHTALSSGINGVSIVEDYDPSRYESYPSPHAYTVFGDEYEEQIRDANGDPTSTVGCTMDVVVFHGFSIEHDPNIGNQLEIKRRLAVAELKRVLRGLTIARYDGNADDDGVADFSPMAIISVQPLHENKDKTYGTGVIVCRVEYQLFTLN